MVATLQLKAPKLIVYFVFFTAVILIILNKINCYIQNFMPHKMIYHLPHKVQIFVFVILRTFSLSAREIYVETTNKAHNFNLLVEPVLMM